MVNVKKLVLDVLKPHQPNALVFAEKVAAVADDCRVHLTVLEVDENTESLQLVIDADALDYDAIIVKINELGGSLHSIDEVEVENLSDDG
ncbi:MAG: DUF211 domain-containing protein [Gammaproteobacteria bacterium]|nr:DUF211 domain-containing protein [Gammaproteobacteria bacterium]